MPDSKRKTISYHRAEYYIEKPESIRLGACIKEASIKLPTVGQRTISRGRGQLIHAAAIQPDKDQKGVFMHLVIDTPGEGASVVPAPATGAEQVVVATASAPEDTEFMDGDAFVYVNGNEICLCATSIKLGTVEYYLQELFKISQIRRDAPNFSLMNVINANKLALIQKKGVKEIELRGSLYSASVDYLKRKDNAVGILLAIANHAKAIFGSSVDATPDALRVAVTLTLDKRYEGVTVGKKRLQQLAENIVTHQVKDDEYVIVTSDEERIKPGEIYVRTEVEIMSIGKSVDRDLAWTELEKYYKELKSSGILSQ